jgi:hypothetical protein
LLKAHWLRSLRLEVRVEKVLVREFIVGVVVDVLGHIRIQYRKSSGVGGIPTSTRDFAVLNSREFVVLNPQIGLQDFRSCCEPKQSRISSGEPTAVFFGFLLG